MLKIFITEESQNQQFVADLEAKKLLTTSITGSWLSS